MLNTSLRSRSGLVVGRRVNLASTAMLLSAFAPFARCSGGPLSPSGVLRNKAAAPPSEAKPLTEHNVPTESTSPTSNMEPISSPSMSSDSEKNQPSDVSEANQRFDAEAAATIDDPSKPGYVRKLELDDGETGRWIVKPFVAKDLKPKVDERGEYIVSEVQWPKGELAYRPQPYNELHTRFGYNIVQVKKHQSYWQYFRKNPHLSVRYMFLQFALLLGFAWMLGFLMEEVRRIEWERQTPGAMAGEVRGRGDSTRATQKIEFTTKEQEAMLSTAQNSWLDGAETNYVGNRDYQMKKIARPTEYSYEDYKKR